MQARSMLSRRFRCTLALTLPVLALTLVAPVFGQMPDQVAEMLLSSARKGYNEKQYSFAQARFREFLQKFGGHKDATSARYGLGLAILDGPEKDRNLAEATQVLTQAAGDGNFADRPYAMYFLGQAQRAQGMVDLLVAAQPGKNPNEVAKFQNDAKPKFDAAFRSFDQSLALLKPLADKAGTKEQSAEAREWLARARADVAEMQLRLGKAKEALTAAEPFLKDKTYSESKHKDVGRYYYGYAAFLLGDMVTAQKTLALTSPFADPEWGTHARYLLARTNHLAGERAEAAFNYEGLLAENKKQIDAARELVKDRNRLDADPVLRRQVDALLQRLPPDHIARATFYLGVLLYEGGKYGEAKARFQEFAKNFAQSPLKGEAELRIGYCQVQAKEFADAVKTLTPLTNDGKLVDQAFLWLGKAYAGAAPDRATKPKEYAEAIQKGIYFLGQALARANQLDPNVYPDAKTRRGEIRLEMADYALLVDEGKRAAAEYQQILAEKLLPDREEEVTVRLAQARHLAKEFAESDATCQEFVRKFPQSPLLAAIAFTYAENAYFKALALEKTPIPGGQAQAPQRAKDLAVLYDETIKRTEDVLRKFPEYPKILLVRHSLALVCYRKGDIERALKEWEMIPSADRNGELGAVPYLMADCILRQVPVAVADDALAIGKLDEQLKQAGDLLVIFLGGPRDPLTPDALLKLGYCQQRSAGFLAQPQEKQKVLQAARGTYELLLKDFASHPLAANARFERAKVMALQGDIGGSFNELSNFTRDPLRQSKVAPMAVVSMATILRAQNRPNEAVDQIQKIRDQQEAAMASDPDRAAWVPVVKFHQAVALQEAGKYPLARPLYQAVFTSAPKSAEGAEALLRLGQCLKAEGAERFESARKVAGKTPVDQSAIGHFVGEGTKLLTDAIAHFEKSATELKNSDGPPDLRARLLYEAAWSYRILADREIEKAKKDVLAAIAAKKGKERPPVEVALGMIPLQPAEKAARAEYKALIDQVGDAPLSIDARFELAEMLAQRDEQAPALVLLSDALDKEPPAELTEKIRLRIGSIQGAKGNVKAALAQFDAVAANPKSPLVGWANYRAAEVYLQNKQYGEAVKRLVPFRDNGQFNNVPGLTDRAMLRLGHAYGAVKAWGESQQAMERVMNQFGNSPWADDARYGRAWARQQMGDLDGAAAGYNEVATRSATELAAKAQYQIGTCRMAQKKWTDAANAFLVVPTTFDYPELSAASLLEAAQAYRELDQRDQSSRLLQRIVTEYAGTPFADLAKEQLEQK
jgi:cellulose synthase operon protein C